MAAIDLGGGGNYLGRRRKSRERELDEKIDSKGKKGPMIPSFQNKVAIVTGAAMGIGEATALKFSELGAAVALLDRNEEKGAAVAGSIAASGGRAKFYSCDVGSGAQIQRAVEGVAADWGGVDVLASCAGIQRYGDVVATEEALWDEVMTVNLKSFYLLCRSVIPFLLQRGGGSIVAVGSVQSITALPNSAAYVTSKHGILGLVRAVALDYAPKKIRVNCVLPGAIDTPMLRSSIGMTPDPHAVLDACNRSHALGRIGKPSEVADAIAYLASDAASFITGAYLVVDGGMLVPAGGMAFSEGGTGAGHGS